jgi:hypothetical protein
LKTLWKNLENKGVLRGKIAVGKLFAEQKGKREPRDFSEAKRLLFSMFWNSV